MLLFCLVTNQLAYCLLLWYNCSSPGGKSHLHYVVESGNKEMLERLLERKADVNVKDYVSTPLHE